MIKKLNTAEIALIDSWIKKRGFTYEDVRLEILDHVVCAVEDLMTADARLSLEKAYQQVHASFGIFGFSTLEDSFVRTTERRIVKGITKQLGQFFTPKYSMLPLSLVLLLVVIQQVFGTIYLLALPLLLSASLLFGKFRLYFTQKSLREHLAFRIAMGGVYVTLPLTTYTLVWWPKIDPSGQFSWVAIVLACLICLMDLAQWMVLQQEMSKHKHLMIKLKKGDISTATF